MMEQKDYSNKGVTCLHCGMRTRIPNSAQPKNAAVDGKMTQSKLSLIRRNICGKEAPYLASEISIEEERPKVASRAA